MVKLEIGNICFSHGKKEILKGITFEAEGGEVVGILGQNGSGKTTLLNCINTNYKPSEGNAIIVDFTEDSLDPGHELRQSSDVRNFTERERSRIIATVEQNSQQSFPFTVLETVRMGRYSRSGIFDECDEDEMGFLCGVMKDVGILEFAHRNACELSGGEWRRVMIAQALVQEPDILLLDEPTLHLDINHQFDLMDLCRDLAKNRHLLIVIVTHDLMLAARYCDKVLIMQSGKIISVGPTSETITEELLAKVFHIKARVKYNETLGGVCITFIGKI